MHCPAGTHLSHHMRKITSVYFTFLNFLLLATAAQAENPHWIWHDNQGAAIQTNEVRYFRKTFEAKGRFAKVLLSAAADDEATIYINGKEVAHPKDYSKPVYEDVASHVQKGRNVIAVRGRNISSDVAGVLVMLEMKTGSRRGDFIVSDETWLASDKEQTDWRELNFDDSGWSKAKSKGKLGDEPWGNVMKLPVATPADSLTVLPGFKAEMIRSSEIGQGSWICMAIDPKGRLIISPQDDRQPLLRMTLSRSGKVSKIEPIAAPVHQAMGMLYSHDSLYVNGHGPNGTGLYRLIDANHNDRFETNEVHFLKKFEGEGEHGYHAVVEGPDKMIYVMNGNHTKVPQGIEPNSPHKNYQEDFLLARQWDANGHAVGILAPGGYVVRTDPEGKKWELMLAGFRNSYDFDFNADGEMFTFDSDMEWDWGLPWYRPTRINHCVLAAEFGWRSGSADWPDYYADSLPATVNIGVGSPTGVKFGTKSNFPEKYRKAFFIFDWSYGRIFAVHLKPDGASYSGDFEVFLKGKPLNLTDLEFGKDGAMYFITGGRGTQSGLYRVSYVGPKPERVAKTKEELEAEKAGAKARAARHALEAYIGKRDPRAVDAAWPYLRSPDRFLSFAARMAIESQPVDRWKDAALLESNTNAALNGLLSLARCGGKETQRDLLTVALKKFPLDSLSVTQKLQKLRIIELSFIRQGKPEEDLAKLAIDKLNRAYPSDNEFVNRELSQLLIYLEATNVVTKTLALLDKAPTQEEQVHYIFYLRNLKNVAPNENNRWGQNVWTVEQRKHYFDWFRFAQEANKGEVTYPQGSPYLVWTNQKKAAERHPADLLRWFKEAGRDYGDGASYPKYLANIRKDAITVLTPDERIALSSWIEDYASFAAFKPTKERHFVQEWTVAELESDLPQAAQGRNFASGRSAYNDAQCIQCHRLGNEGGSIGPELTAAFSKYSRRDILESIIDPSKVVSDQFQNYIVTKKDGDSATGKIIDETADRIVIQPNPLSPERIEIKKSEIAERKPSKVSPMPAGLLNQFSKDEILDLLGYLESMGKEKGPNFKPVAEVKQ
jgi:putative heme-binding domain-containing protein